MELKKTTMNKFTAYFEEAYDELMHKVTWPTWGELQDSAVVVLIAAVLISVVVLLIDVSFKEGTSLLYNVIIGK
jgi:preprotein translocase subunit SecE